MASSLMCIERRTSTPQHSMFSRKTRKMLFLLGCMVILPINTNAILCYTCSYLQAYLDSTCLHDAEGVQLTNCTKKYCTITRQELSRNGQVLSFLRDCQDKPVYLNTIKVDADFKTYHLSCTQDLCNDGDGKEILVASDLADYGAAPNSVIKGISKNGVVQKACVSHFLLLVIVVAVCVGNQNNINK